MNGTQQPARETATGTPEVYAVSPAEALWRLQTAFTVPELLQQFNLPSHSIGRAAIQIGPGVTPAQGVKLPPVVLHYTN